MQTTGRLCDAPQLALQVMVRLKHVAIIKEACGLVCQTYESDATPLLTGTAIVERWSGRRGTAHHAKRGM